MHGHRVQKSLARQGKIAITLRGDPDNEQLATITRILDGYCELAGLPGSHPARDQPPKRLMALLANSIDDPADVKRELDEILRAFASDFRAL